jgi:hypothetical protein
LRLGDRLGAAALLHQIELGLLRGKRRLGKGDVVVAAARLQACQARFLLSDTGLGGCDVFRLPSGADLRELGLCPGERSAGLHELIRRVVRVQLGDRVARLHVRTDVDEHALHAARTLGEDGDLSGGANVAAV